MNTNTITNNTKIENKKQNVNNCNTDHEHEAGNNETQMKTTETLVNKVQEEVNTQLPLKNLSNTQKAHKQQITLNPSTKTLLQLYSKLMEDNQ